jgi:hypothetical protein
MFSSGTWILVFSLFPWHPVQVAGYKSLEECAKAADELRANISMKGSVIIHTCVPAPR